MVTSKKRKHKGNKDDYRHSTQKRIRRITPPHTQDHKRHNLKFRFPKLNQTGIYPLLGEGPVTQTCALIMMVPMWRRSKYG